MAGLDPAIHVFSLARPTKPWMPGSSPGMTSFAKFTDFGDEKREPAAQKVSQNTCAGLGVGHHP
jgi:hypothetical protein